MVIDLTPDQKSTIYRHLTRLNLSEFQDYFEEVLKSGDYALGLMFVNAVKDKVETEASEKLIALQNMRLASAIGGLAEISWRKNGNGKQDANGN